MPKAIVWSCRIPFQRLGWPNCYDVWINCQSASDLVGRGAGGYTHRARVRRGMDGLSSIVQQALGHSPCAGSAFVFRNRAGNRLRLLLWDGNGVWLCQRRLHRGHFTWPKATDACFSINQAQWQWLIAGVDWQRLSATPQDHWQV